MEDIFSDDTAIVQDDFACRLQVQLTQVAVVPISSKRIPAIFANGQEIDRSDAKAAQGT
ncbi:MAG TPA: hypothetical protein VFV38_47220 [Ktedonobacteraceae bacterium]|nr:hypothetical protein [Ktedonobacteraceae bacterium]